MDTSYSNQIHPASGVRPLSTALRTLEVLDALADSLRPMKLPEVARALGLSRSTAYQRLLTLVEAGLVDQDEELRYRLSLHVCRLGAAALEHADLGHRAQPVLEALVQDVRETASIAVFVRGLPCIVARVESDSLLRAEQKIGTMLSLEGSASGRILVAHADEARLERLKASGEELPPEDVLSAVRADGHALSSGYTHSGVIAIATPVFDFRGRCVAALSLILPETRFELEPLKTALTEAARKLTEMQQGSRG